MSDKPENGLKQELDRRKRINRIKSIIVSFVGIWNAGICHFVCNTFCKSYSLRE